MPVIVSQRACRIEPPRPNEPKFGSARHLGGQRLGVSARGASPLILPVARAPRDQKVQNCTAHAYLRTVENIADINGVPLPDLSAMWTYYLARLQHGETDRDEGSYLSTVAEVSQDPGVSPETDWPEDAQGGIDLGVDADPEGRGRPPPAAVVDSFDRVVDGYVDIDDPIVIGDEAFLDQLEDALHAQHFPATGFDVGSDFERYAGGGDVFGPPSDVRGRHAMYIRGVRGLGFEREWMLGNSWSSSWGDAGYAWISTPYMLTARGTRVATRAPR